MKEEKQYQSLNFNDTIKEIDNIIQNLISYFKYGISKLKDSYEYIKIYRMIQNLADEGDECGYLLSNYYNETIKKFIMESKKELGVENNYNF